MKFISKKKLKRNAAVLLRLDFNTEDDWRMEASLPTVRHLLKQGAKVIILSHRGRPEGFDESLSLRKNAEDLSRLLKKPIVFFPAFDFEAMKTTIEEGKPGTIYMLENLRFEKGEGENSAKFAKQLASLADIYVNDAFAVSHRPNASVVAIARMMPSYAGLELEREVTELSKVRKPKKPLVVVLGGAKAYDKLGVMKKLRDTADYFLIGGGAANTLLAIRGVDVRKSLVEEDPKHLNQLKSLLSYEHLILPCDLVSKDDRILDIGEFTIATYEEFLKDASTIFWSGPLGYIEDEKFQKGSLEVAKAIIKNRKAVKITGGGETVMFLKKFGLDKKFDFISTGGTALIEYLAGGDLVGLKALK